MAHPAAEPLLLGLDLRGRRVLAVGGGAVAERRIGDLLAAGADVLLVAPDATAGLRSRAARGDLMWRRRRYAEADLAGCWLVHTATGDRSVDDAVAAACDRQRIWCVHAGDAARTTARNPARGRLQHEGRSVAFAVLTGDPRRSVRLRNHIQALLGARHVTPGRNVA